MEDGKLVEYLALVGLTEESLRRNCQDTLDGGSTEDPTTDLVFSTPFQAEVLSRCPREDVDDFPLQAANLPVFCFPRNLSLQRQSALVPPHSFVLTKADGSSIFGFVHTFLEEFTVERIKKGQKGNVADNSGAENHSGMQHAPDEPIEAEAAEAEAEAEVEVVRGHVPKCLVLLSRWPLFTTFHQYLKQIVAFSRTEDSVRRIPIEALLSLVCYDVPLPAPGGPAIIFGVPTPTMACPADPSIFRPLALRRPPASDLPWLDVPSTLLLSHISVKNLVSLFRFLVLERRVILVASDVGLLAPLAEFLTKLLFPLDWQHVFIPVLPQKLLHFLEAPVPYLVGFERGFLEMVTLPEDTILYDVDGDELFIFEDSLPPLPHTQEDTLTDTLTQLAAAHKEVALCADAQQSSEATERELARELRTAFLDFFVSLLLEYESWLLLPGRTRASTRDTLDLDTESVFDDQSNGRTDYVRLLSHPSLLLLAEFFLLAPLLMIPQIDLEGFLAEFEDPQQREFVAAVAKTQCFACFIDAKVHGSEDVDFFDESIRRKFGYISSLSPIPGTQEIEEPYVVSIPPENPSYLETLQVTMDRLLEFPFFTEESLAPQVCVFPLPLHHPHPLDIFIRCKQRPRSKSALRHLQPPQKRKTQRHTRGAALMHYSDFEAANSEFRKVLLEQFQESIRDLILAFKLDPLAQGSSSSSLLAKPLLSSREAGVMKFCHHVEQIFFHGAKRRKHSSKSAGQGSLWDCVKNSALSNLAESINVVESLNHVRFFLFYFSSFLFLALLLIHPLAL